MKKVGIFYSFNTGKTQSVGERILKEFGDIAEVVDIETVSTSKLLEYDLVVIGSSTWYDGKLPDYWEDIIPEMKKENFEGKNIAIFGLGNQQGYPDNFGDSLHYMAEVFTPLGANLVGFTDPAQYDFNESKALKDGVFIGLLIDEETQPELTKERIANWVKELKAKCL